MLTTDPRVVVTFFLHWYAWYIMFSDVMHFQILRLAWQLPTEILALFSIVCTICVHNILYLSHCFAALQVIHCADCLPPVRHCSWTWCSCHTLNQDIICLSYADHSIYSVSSADFHNCWWSMMLAHCSRWHISPLQNLPCTMFFSVTYWIH